LKLATFYQFLLEMEMEIEARHLNDCSKTSKHRNLAINEERVGAADLMR
jgi:hypothetical protein